MIARCGKAGAAAVRASIQVGGIARYMTGQAVAVNGGAQMLP
jgi:hypothetical protein